MVHLSFHFQVLWPSIIVINRGCWCRSVRFRTSRDISSGAFWLCFRELDSLCAFPPQRMRAHQIEDNFHNNWARHTNDHHKEEGDDAAEKSDDGDDDGADQMDDVQPEEAAEPKKRYGPKISERRAAAPVRRQRVSAGDRGTQTARKPQGKAACKKKSKPE